uniref:Uncharacterized protein n=1 Tax=Oryza rufipogon TaxID=4529 RepID=A0A0E0QPU3_ORYRU
MHQRFARVAFLLQGWMGWNWEEDDDDDGSSCWFSEGAGGGARPGRRRARGVSVAFRAATVATGVADPGRWAGKAS